MIFELNRADLVLFAFGNLESNVDPGLIVGDIRGNHNVGETRVLIRGGNAIHAFADQIFAEGAARKEMPENGTPFFDGNKCLQLLVFEVMIALEVQLLDLVFRAPTDLVLNAY